MTPRKKKTELPKPAARPEEGFELPRNLEAERSTLGAALLHVAAADYITDKLSVEAYFRRAHQDVFTAIRELRLKNVDVDLTTLKNELQRTKKLEDVGGPAYISSLVDGVPRTTNVAHYCNILRDLQAKRGIAMFANTTLDLVAAGEHHADELLVDADRRLMDLQAGHIDGRLRALKESAGELLNDMEWRHAHKGEITGIETGFKNINDETGGWQPGDLIVIAARPSVGKTTFLANSLVACSSMGKKAAIFSFEMTRKQLEYRILSELSGVELSRILTGFTSEAAYAQISQAFSVMGNLPIWIDDKKGQTWGDIRVACRRLKSEQGLDIVGIDYVQMIPGSLDRRGANRNEEVTDIVNGLKALADDLEVPILLLSQLTRENTKRNDPRPRLSDLRESGSLEQVADVVCFLHRKDHRAGGSTQFILEKQRMGPTGVVYLDLMREVVTFRVGIEPKPEPKEEKAKPAGPPKPPRERKHAEQPQLEA